MNCRGIALVTGLLLLAAIALLAVTAAGNMTLQQHQAANFTDRLRAESRADVAESHALAWLYSRDSTERQMGCSRDCLLPAGIHPDRAIPDQPEIMGAEWWQDMGTAAGRHPLSGEQLEFAAGTPAESIWIIEEIHYQSGPEDALKKNAMAVAHYRLLNRGQGTHPGSVAVTETIVARPWGDGVQAIRYPPESSLFKFCRQFGEDVPCGVRSWRQRR